MQKKLTGKLMSIFLAVLMIFGTLPVTAFAANFGDAVQVKRDHWISGMNYDFQGYKDELNLPHNSYGQHEVLRTTNGDYTYCIELGEKVAGNREDIDREYANLSKDQQDFIKYALVYGFNGTTRYGYSADEEYAATQAVIWAICYNDFNNSRESLYLERVFSGSTGAHRSNATAVYNRIKAQILTHETTPSFHGSTVTLKYDPTSKTYKGTITDSANVLQYYTVSDAQGLTTSKQGNKLTITASSYSANTKTITFDRTSNQYCNSLPRITLGFISDSGQDNVIAVNLYDPIYARLNVKMEGLGNAKIIKQSEDGNVAGLRFRITGNGVNEVITTGTDGTIVKSNLTPGTYTVTEIDTPNKYVQPESQTVTVTPGQTAVVNFSNVLKKFTVTLTKTDSETVAAQGDASLQGAVYGLYNGNDLVETLTTDAEGKATSKEYVCGDNWTVKEITPPEGYQLDATVYTVGAEPGNFTIEKNNIGVSATDQVIKGKIAIVKYLNDTDDQIKSPEANAEFEIYLKSAGSYAAAEEYERDYLKTDSNGNAVSKNLPYGTYIVHQVKGSEGFFLVDDFEVEVTQNEKTYQFILNNELIASKIKIVKQDAETHKVIPISNVGFKIRNTDTGEFVTMHISYPTEKDLDVFYTDNSGSCTLPEPLRYGNYELIEISAPDGYVLDGTPIPFKVQDGKDIVLTKEDMPQKGKITVTKTGEVFASVSEENGQYTPVYTIQGLAGTVFEVKAAEDIYTPDGTLRYHEGQLVDTITTNANGTATTKELYLGSYLVTEKKAVDGYLLDTNVYGVELVYAGQEEQATAANLALENTRQKVHVDLSKMMEEDTLFGIGMNNELKNVVFGIYAAEDITAKDGKTIPANGLIELVNVDENGHAAFSADLPFGKYYVQEYATDSHYILSDEKYEIEFAYNGPEIAIVSISANGGEVINNELIRGDIYGKKVDEDGFAVGGALMGLFRPDETVFTEETALMTCESNEIGVFGFSDVPYGEYIVREIKAPDAFVLNETLYPVTISEDGEVVEIEVENRFLTGAVEVVKADADYTDQKLTGAEFEVYVDVDGDKKFDPEIDRLVDELEEVENGVYRLEGLRYNGYFLHEKTAPEGFLLDDGYYYFHISENEETVVIENKEGTGLFLNKPITGKLELTKTDVSTGAALPNAGFRIKNAETGEVVAEGYTDENGIAEFTLRYGKYTYQEFDAPDGYEIDEKEYPFEIKENGEIIKAQMTNTPIPAPKTGVDTNTWLYGIVLGSAILVTTGLVITYNIVKRRKKRNEAE